MFGHADLLQSGVETRGLVIDKHVTSRSRTALNTISYTVMVRVRFEDASVNEFQSGRLYASKVGNLCPGDVIPVRYDLDARSRMVVDTNAMVAAKDQQDAA
jgi:hypothetical protein